MLSFIVLKLVKLANVGVIDLGGELSSWGFKRVLLRNGHGEVEDAALVRGVRWPVHVAFELEDVIIILWLNVVHLFGRFVGVVRD